MYKREDFVIDLEHRGYFIHTFVKPLWSYLTKNNIIKTWSDLSKDSIPEAEGLIFFNTRQDTEETLDKFLKGQNMSLQAKRDQCIADIGVLQGNLAEIDKEIDKQKETFKHGQWFKDGRGSKYLLTQVDYMEYILADTNGNRRRDKVSVTSGYITWDDLNRMHSFAVGLLTPIEVSIKEN